MANDWRDGLGLAFIERVEDLLERTMRRRMDDALNVVKEIDFYDDETIDGARRLETPKDFMYGTKEEILAKVLSNRDCYEGGLFIALKDLLTVLERLGEIVIPTTEQQRKEQDNGTDNE
jgi:hypothetical protein